MSNLTHSHLGVNHLRKSGVKIKLWPNGELSIFREKRFNPAKMASASRPPVDSLKACLVRAYGVSGALAALRSLGLSPHHNFDSPPPSGKRYGLKGISGKGKRRVRNACFLLTRENGKHRLTFSTVTLPPLEPGILKSAHENWHRLIDFYRREIGRQLRRGGLSGEIVGVSEIQEGRYEKSGKPILHAHFVFVGAARNGGWIVTPSRHDAIWEKALESVLGISDCDVSKACQLKSVSESAEGYLGKYMSKGGGVVARVIADGYGDWLPRQWWNCSRSLVKRIDSQLRIFSHGVDWLISKAIQEENDFFVFFKNVEIERDDGSKLAIASYGRLTKKANGLIRKVLKLEKVGIE